MEKFVLGAFQDQLSKFIVGFRKEQVDASLLNGKGEIRDVELNCDFLNENVSKVSPLISFESVHVTKLSFHVSSWANIRKAPILVDIEHIRATIREAFHFSDELRSKKTIEQITKEELQRLIREGVVKTRSSYNLFDRLLDNLTVEVASVNVTLQPWGRFKTMRVGPWTPPTLHLSLAAIKFVSVNEYGQEAPPEEVWRHNQNATESLVIYKKLEMEYKIAIIPTSENNKKERPIPLVTGKDYKMQVQIAVERRVRDAEVMAVQVDVVIPNVSFDLTHATVPHVAHAAAGVFFLLTKDREFQDPLVPTSQSAGDAKSSSSAAQQPSKAPVKSEPTVAIQSNPENDSDEEDDNKSGVHSLGEFEEAAFSEGEDGAKTDPSTPTRPSAQPLPQQGFTRSTDRPVIMLPNGVIIHDSVSISVSIHEASLRGTYDPSIKGYFEFLTKGCVTELIWPTTTHGKGGYLQQSVAYLSLEEHCGDRIRMLLSGGARMDEGTGVESPATPLKEVGKDESFPLFEDRVVRQDPMGVRNTFPTQTFGFKTSMEIVQKAGTEKEEALTLHELGVDTFSITADTESWCRIARFCVNEFGGGFDARWYTGDWTSLIDADMLVAPPLQLQECLQSMEVGVLDENDFVSSDLFNLTARLSAVSVRMPAALEENLQACDIVASANEAMIIVSSALPRAMLSTGVGKSLGRDDEAGEGVQFPNDMSDIAYSLEKAVRARDEDKNNLLTTFRAQCTGKGCTLELRPAIPIHDSGYPMPLMEPCGINVIICVEGEPPAPSNNDIARTVVWTSFLIHHTKVNIDLSLIAAAISTISYHLDVAQKSIKLISDPFHDTKSQVHSDNVPLKIEDGKIPKTMEGRRVLVERQINKSLDSGGITLCIATQVVEFAVSLWVPNHAVDQDTGSSPVAVNALNLMVRDVDVRGEALLLRHSRRATIKMCVLASQLTAFNFSKSPTRAENNSIEIWRFGTLSDVNVESECALALRIEEVSEEKRRWAVSLQFGNHGYLPIRPDTIESVVLKLFEAMLSPVNPRRLGSAESNKRFHMFPIGSVGDTLLSVIPQQEGDSVVSVASLLEQADNASPIPGQKVDTFMRLAIQNILPSNLETILIRARVEDLRIGLPSVQVSSEESVYLFNLHVTDFLAAYFVNGRTSEIDSILKTTCGRKESWTDVIETFGDGLQHRINSRQSVGNMSGSEIANGASDNQSFLIPPFDFSYKYSNAKAHLSMQGGIEIGEMSLFKDLLNCMIDFVRQSHGLILSLSYIASTIKASPDPANTEDGSPIEIALAKLETSVRTSKTTMHDIRKQLIRYDHAALKHIEELERYMELLRFVAFKKEKERLAALSVASSQIAGWLRIGTASRTGLRGTMSATLLPFWAVLRKGMLVIFRGPGVSTVVEIIALNGARLLNLSGGRTKREVKRAFGLCQRSGLFHLLVANNDREYVSWTRELQSSISMYTDSSVEDSAPPTAASNIGQSNSDPSSFDPDMMGGEPNPSQGNVLNRGISRAVQVARATKQAVTDRSIRRKDSSDSETVRAVGSLSTTVASTEPDAPVDDESSSRLQDLVTSGADTASVQGQSDAPNRRSQIKNRLVGVGQVTKSRFGSAMQKARQKGREVAERTRQIRQAPNSTVVGIQNLTNSNPAVAKGAPVVQTQAAEWGCATCTYRNYAGAGTCEMCGAPKPLAPTVAARSTVPPTAAETGPPPTEISVTNQAEGQNLSDNSADATKGGGDQGQPPDELDSGDDGEGKGKVRQRLGAAVRGVAKSGRDALGVAKSGRDALIFRNRGPQSRLDASETPLHGAPPATKIRGVRAKDSFDVSEHPFGNQVGEEVLLKRLKGSWFVRVTLKTEENPTPTSARQSIPMGSTSNNRGKEENSLELEQGFPQASSIESNGGKEVSEVTNSDTLGSSMDNGTIPPIEEIEKPSALVFKVFKGKGTLGTPVSQVTREFSDVYALHTAISESVGHVMSPGTYGKPMGERNEVGTLDRRLASSLGLSSLENVRMTASLLNGLLEDNVDETYPVIQPITSYHVDVVSEFLNSMMETELPIDALLTLTEFLELSEASTQMVLDLVPKDDRVQFRSKFERDFEGIRLMLKEVYRLSAACESELLRVDRHRVMVSRFEKAAKLRNRTSEKHQLMVPSFHVSEQFHQSIRNIIDRITSERDCSLARMNGSDVLHSHELEFQRRRTVRLEAELDMVRSMQSDSAIAKMKKQIMDNSDEELLSLCQQLSGEITARTEAALEIERMKETHKMERTMDTAEKLQLQVEVERLRKELEKAQKDAQAAVQESAMWKQSYEEVMENEKAVTS